MRAPAPGTVLGLIALIVALAGTAVALPGKKQIDKNDLRPNVVKSKHIAPDTVAGADVNEASLGAVPTAVNATDSDRVDGHDAVCPAATFLRNGVCFDNAARPDIGYITAVQDCADTGGRLPSISELQAIRSLVDLGPAGDGHWADIMYDDDGTASAMSVYGAAGAIETQAVSGLRPYRCVYPLVR